MSQHEQAPIPAAPDFLAGGGEMGALIRSSLEFQGSDLSEVVERHRTLVDAVRTRDRDVMAEAIREHYLDPSTFLDHDGDHDD